MFPLLFLEIQGPVSPIENQTLNLSSGGVVRALQHLDERLRNGVSNHCGGLLVPIRVVFSSSSSSSLSSSSVHSSST